MAPLAAVVYNGRSTKPRGWHDYYTTQDIEDYDYSGQLIKIEEQTEFGEYFKDGHMGYAKWEGNETEQDFPNGYYCFKLM